MSTRRAKRHQRIVLRQKAFRYFKRHRGSYYYVWSNQRMAGELERAISRYALTHNRVVKGIDVSVALDSLFKNSNEQITIRVNK